jgi:hypothetical protein
MYYVGEAMPNVGSALSNPKSNHFAKVCRIAGIVLFVVAFLLPAVREGANSYPGWFCAVETLYWTATFVAMLYHHERSLGPSFYMMISGWISPLVLLGLIPWTGRIRRSVTMVLPFLLIAPWIVFAWPGQSGFQIRPTIGHYIWTAGCLLIFTPEYVTLFKPRKKIKNEDAERN